MKIFISVDIEGVAGVCEPVQGQRGNAEYETARRLMTEEASAAVQGAFDGGATEVVVADSHGPMRNIIADQLDPRALLVSGKPRPLSMAQGLRPDHDGMVLIGYHAAAGEPGVLSHTISGLAFSRIRVAWRSRPSMLKSQSFASRRTSSASMTVVPRAWASTLEKVVLPAFGRPMTSTRSGGRLFTVLSPIVLCRP